MPFETIIPAEYMYHRRPWKSEQQHINEYLHCAGLPYRQNDMTNLHTGMQYVGKEPEPLFCRIVDGSIRVYWTGVPGEPRVIEYRRRPVKQALPWAGGFV
jgi:hypothetical protein